MIPIAKPYLTKDEAQAAYDVVLSGWVTQGPKVAEFEEKFSKYTSAENAVAVSSCTTALHVALIVAGIKHGDEVICPSMSYIATANSIVYTGATPVFAEVNEQFNIDPIHAESLISPKTKAILIVHQIGMPADIDAFKDICKRHKLLLIEDAACAIGSEYKGKKIGSHSELVCFSFHPRKVITTGDGGMITTPNPEYYKRLKALRQHAMTVNDLERHKSSKIITEEYPEVGYNYRMTDIQAAVGIKQLEKLDWILQERRKIALKYNESLESCNHIILPVEKIGYFSNYQSYAVILKDSSPIKRDALMQAMLDKGIATRRGVMTAHNEKAYAKVKTILPTTDLMSNSSIILPLFVGMSESEQDFVITNFKQLLQ
jgi:Predicted pyridoxal phosphate-dependent enzyme apparently involved in regulation of cell wall biogenesis